MSMMMDMIQAENQMNEMMAQSNAQETTNEMGMMPIKQDPMQQVFTENYKNPDMMQQMPKPDMMDSNNMMQMMQPEPNNMQMPDNMPVMPNMQMMPNNMLQTSEPNQPIPHDVDPNLWRHDIREVSMAVSNLKFNLSHR